MKAILSAGLVGVVLFAASASVSWYLQHQKAAHQAAENEDHAEQLEPEILAGIPNMGKGIEKEKQLPVAVRPDVPLTVEAILELSDSIRKKEQELIARERAIEKSEQNIKLLFEDLKIERAEVTAMLEGIEAKLRLAQDSVTTLRQENQTLTTKTQELSKLKQQQDQQKKKSGGEELDEIGQRVKTAKSWFEGLEDEQAASFIRQFANNGDLQFAVRLLKSLQQRKASKILAALDDPEFVQQILNALTEQKTDDESDDIARRRNEMFR